MNETRQSMKQTPPQNQTLPVVRAQVKEILTQSQAFRELPPDKRQALANDMVKVAHFIVGDTPEKTPRAVTLATPRSATPASQRGAAPAAQKPPDPAGDTAGQRFAQSGAVAAQQGVADYTDLVQKVDFPKFVAGLIHGVFDAIVSSSIKQMEAYADLVKNVAKSVDQYMKDNITTNQARDYLAGRYPEHLEVDLGGNQPKLKPREGHDEDSLPDFFADLGLSSPVTSLDESAVEEELVPAARRRMAMDRQQLLATMVLMGINRLVVTDGHIEASVLFELDTKDEVKRNFNLTTDFDRSRISGSESGSEGNHSSEGREGGFLWWGGKDVKDNSSWYGKNYAEDTAKFKVSTTRSEDSTAKVDLHSNLSGKVRVNFKSETFPLERMADVLQIDQIREKAPGAPAPTGATAPQTPKS